MANMVVNGTAPEDFWPQMNLKLPAMPVRSKFWGTKWGTVHSWGGGKHPKRTQASRGSILMAYWHT